jgi:hypothetical protein
LEAKNNPPRRGQNRTEREKREEKKEEGINRMGVEKGKVIYVQEG